MEIISAKEAHERTAYTIPTGKERIINMILTDIQIEINKGSYSLEYLRKYVDDWFFGELVTSIVQDFFERLGYHYTYSYGNFSGDDSITISW